MKLTKSSERRQGEEPNHFLHQRRRVRFLTTSCSTVASLLSDISASVNRHKSQQQPGDTNTEDLHTSLTCYQPWCLLQACDWTKKQEIEILISFHGFLLPTLFKPILTCSSGDFTSGTDVCVAI